jgi:hypothetical protein
MKPVDGKRHQKTIPSTTRPRRRPPPKAASWDQQKAVELASKGIGPSDIATVVGVSGGIVRLYLKRVAPELEALRTFKDRLGDSLALTLAKCSDLEDKLLDALNDETVLASLSTTEKERLLGRVTIAKGVTYDKWRLQTGKSTQEYAHEIQLKMVHESLPFIDAPSSAAGNEETPDENY